MTEPAYRVSADQWPHAFGRPGAAGVLRSRNEDFRVEEVLGFALEGDGPHLWLWVEKSGANTDWTAGRIARLAGVKKRDVGFSGMKDRHAVTVQWFSLPLPDAEPDWTPLEADGIRVLEQVRHRKKLKRGVHAANRFVITLRDVTGADDVEQRLAAIRSRGVPNYFGEQRFGRNGDNVIRALDGARGGIYLSSMRSFLFNAVLGERTSHDNWDAMIPGEVLQLAGSRSFFPADDDPSLQERLAAFDIHPSGPMWGSGELPTRADARDLELQTAGRYPELRERLESAGLKHERRSLRLAVSELEADFSSDVLRLSFKLETGAFATSVLREIINYTMPAGDEHA